MVTIRTGRSVRTMTATALTAIRACPQRLGRHDRKTAHGIAVTRNSSLTSLGMALGCLGKGRMTFREVAPQSEIHVTSPIWAKNPGQDLDTTPGSLTLVPAATRPSNDSAMASR